MIDHGAAVAAHHADRHDTAYGSVRADNSTARRTLSHRGGVVQGRRHG